MDEGEEGDADAAGRQARAQREERPTQRQERHGGQATEDRRHHQGHHLKPEEPADTRRTLGNARRRWKAIWKHIGKAIGSTRLEAGPSVWFNTAVDLGPMTSVVQQIRCICWVGSTDCHVRQVSHVCAPFVLTAARADEKIAPP